MTVTSGLVGTYYVAPTGNDANAGTATAPFSTIQKAADVVVPGDVVIVDNGVYTDTDGDGSVVAINRGGTAGAWVTFRARNQWGAKLDGVNGTAAQGFDLNNGVGYVRIEGFEIYGVANRGSPTTGRGSASGIDLYDGGHDSQIVGNHIHDIGRVCTLSTNTNGQVAIFVQVPNVTIERNLIHDIGRFFPGENGCSYTGFTGYQTLDHGVYLNGGAPGADGVMIRNNIFYNTRHGWAVQMYPGSLTNMNVLNNTFAFGNPNKNYTHIVLDASISNSLIANNIFYNPEAGRTIEAQGFSGTITVSHNITTGSAMTDVSTPSGMTLINNRLNTNPLFVNAPADFHLKAGSPAIDAGVSLTLVTIDFDGVVRPTGTAYDIGAYES
ncbi:MAG: choice-of-anchor Q domain-containing protein [Gemmatimonadales bacterium]